MSTPQYFARVIPDVNFSLLQTKRVVVVGVGQVGSKIAAELAHVGIRYLRFIDHDVLEAVNLYRHELPAESIGWNKADELAIYLASQVDGLRTDAVPCRVDRSVTDGLLDSWLADADLIVAATDDPEAQLRIGARALALEIPAIFPALYPQDNGGEIIVQFDRELPCFGCVAGFRANIPQLNAVAGLSFFGLPVIAIAIKLALAILEPGSAYARLITPVQDEPPHQMFELDHSGTLESRPLVWFADCSSCSAHPPPLRQEPWIPQEAPSLVMPEPRPMRSQASGRRPESEVMGAFLTLLGAAVATGVVTLIFTVIISTANQGSLVAALLVPVFGFGSLVGLVGTGMALLALLGTLWEAINDG